MLNNYGEGHSYLGQANLNQLNVPPSYRHSVPRHELHLWTKSLNLLLILETPLEECNQRSRKMELWHIKLLVKGDHMGPNEIFKEEIVKLLLQW